MTLSIIIPALNEEENLTNTIKNIIQSLNNRQDYEILIFNDGSTDNTGQIADDLAFKNNHIRVIHHETPQNLGGCFREGVALAKGEYTIMLPGDNETHPLTIKNIFDSIGLASLITTYTINKEVRNLKRRLVSAFYTHSLNFLFNLNLKYFTGPTLIKTELLKKVSISSSLAYISEILIRLIKSGYDYKEIEMLINPSKGRTSRTLKLKNITGVVKTIFKLFIDIYFKKKILYGNLDS